MAEDGQSGNGVAQQQNEQKDEQSRRPPYSMHGVLHFLQHEWSKYEMEKAKWDMERAEMQARISFLQGEKRTRKSEGGFNQKNKDAGILPQAGKS